MKREVERFSAIADDGFITTVIVHQESDAKSTQDVPMKHIPSLRSARTLEGFACTRKDDNTFVISNDPSRPNCILRRLQGEALLAAQRQAAPKKPARPASGNRPKDDAAPAKLEVKE